MNLPPPKNRRNLFLAISIVAVFAFLMIFGLKHNPNFTPSQLVGKRAPSFTAQLSTGNQFQFKTNEQSNSWTILNFWSSSCYVCREEAPELQSFYQTVTLMNKNNPQFLSVNIQDDTKSILEWQKSFSQTFPVMEDTKGLISVDYGVTGTPETFFIDPNRIVRYRLAGAVNKKLILKFVNWLSKNPTATESEAVKTLISIGQEG
ncbi:MAG: TlpA disulfide reductase family protein [Bdellovibrionota bacterium]